MTPGEELTIWVGAGASGRDGAWGFGCGGEGGEGEGITAQDGGGGSSFLGPRVEQGGYQPGTASVRRSRLPAGITYAGP